MDGQQLRIVPLKYCIALLFLFTQAQAMAEESLDMEFLEWLGQTASIDELGIDVDLLLLQQQENKQTDDENEAEKP